MNDLFSASFTKGISNPVNLTSYTDEVMSELVITEEVVKRKLQAIDVSKAMGPDEIPGFILKTFSEELAVPLTLLFNRMYAEGSVPALLKSANVIPLHKKGKKNLAKNYRPISLTPIITMIFGNIYADHLVKHLDDNHIISNAQHGFRRIRSTKSNMLEFWDTITEYADQSIPDTVIYTDLRKAFDSVPHDLLLQKLEAYGIKGRNLEWLRSYLDNRK